MGQYYKVVNVDKMESMSPWQYDNGAKLMEHSYAGNNFVMAVESLIMEGRPWNRNRIVWAGDYGDEGLFLDEDNQDTNLYGYEYLDELDVIDEKERLGRYIINYTLEEYVDMADYADPNERWVIHPLPLLTVSGNDRGGGDYHLPQNEYDSYVGSWAGDVIGSSHTAPSNFAKINPKFKEER